MAILTNKVSGLTKTKLIDLDSVISINSMNIANIHSSDSVSIDLYIASQIATDITDTSTNSAMEIIATTNSTTLTVDSTAATSDVFENEKVWKSDGTLFGTCTARNSNTEIVFAGGLESQITNNDVLHTGTRYILFDQITVPAKSTLKLEQDEISFNNAKHDLYCKSGDSDGQLVFTFIY